MSDLDVLRTLRDQIVPPPLDALRQTARRRTRRSNALAAVAASAAVVALVATTVVVTGDDADRSPLPAPPPERSSRPLTYADGAVVHYGDRTVDAGGPVVELDLTDHGVVFRTADGRIWFTDGSRVDELGALGEPGPTYDDDNWPLLVHDGWLVSAHTGSRVAWFEFPSPGAPEVVVYDTAEGRELARDAVSAESSSVTLPYLVSERYVYWFADADPNLDVVDTPQVRFDPATGEQTPAAPEEVQEDLLGDGPERTVVIGGGTVTDGTDRNFAIERGRVVPQGEQPLIAEDGLTGRRFVFDAPAGYPRQVAAYLTQWRDDDTIVLLSALRRADELLECHVDTGACEVVMSGAPSLVFPEVG